MLSVLDVGAISSAVLGLAFLVLVGALTLAAVRYGRAPGKGTAAVVASLAIGSALAGGLAAYGTYQTAVSSNTWAFDYDLSVQANGTSPESIVVPIPQDEGLLAGLRLSSGDANWSLVNTSRGRGLYVRFTGAATISASVSLVPRPAVFPDTRPTMAIWSNCTAEPSNCTGLPELWIFYSGPSGASLVLSMPTGTVAAFLASGWGEYEIHPPAVPALQPRTFL